MRDDDYDNDDGDKITGNHTDDENVRAWSEHD